MYCSASRGPICFYAPQPRRGNNLLHQTKFSWVWIQTEFWQPATGSALQAVEGGEEPEPAAEEKSLNATQCDTEENRGRRRAFVGIIRQTAAEDLNYSDKSGMRRFVLYLRPYSPDLPPIG